MTDARALHPPADRPQLPPLTGLRFLAAFSVFTEHALPSVMPYKAPAPMWYDLIASAGGIGMPLFFVLSGFVIQYNYGSEIYNSPTKGVCRFFVARFARLYPLYLCCILFEIIYKFGYSQSPQYLHILLPLYLTMTQTWVYFILNDHALVYQFGQILQVAWSISTEWFFYCTYPLVCFVLARLAGYRSKLLSVAALVAGTTIAFWLTIKAAPEIDALSVARFGPVAGSAAGLQDSFIRWLVYFFPLSQLPAFLLGCLTAALYMQDRDRRLSAREEKWGAIATVACAAAVVVIFCCEVWSAASLLLGVNALLIPAITGLLFCCARYRSWVAAALSAGWIILCGEASYSLYLLHPLIIDAFRWESAPISAFKVGVSDFERLMVTTGAAVGLSLITFTIIERPARRFLVRHLAPRPTSEKGPVGSTNSWPARSRRGVRPGNSDQSSR